MPEDSRKIFQENLIYYMSVNKISQQDIVSALGVSKSTVSDWCHGKNYPRIDVMQRLADYLGVVMNKLTAANDHSDEITPEEKALIELYRNASSQSKKSAYYILNENDSLSPDEITLISGYRSLNQAGQHYMLTQLTAAKAIYGEKTDSVPKVDHEIKKG